MNGHGETTIATIAAAAQQKHYRRPQAVVGGEEQQQQQLQQKQHYYLSNYNNNSNNSRDKNVLQSVHHHHHPHQHNPALVQQQQHHNHQHRQHQKRQQQHQQYQLLHGNQMQYYHQLPVIVNGQQQQQQQQHQNGSGGDGLVRVGGAGGGGGGGGYASSSTTTSSSPSSSSTAAAAIIVVDPPRPPFIPKKPVLNNGNSAAVDDEHPPRHNNRIYAQANGDCENGGGAVNGGAAMALFDDCSNGTKITQTTITYIGGAAAAAAATTAGLRRTKSPATVMMATDIEQYNNGGGAAADLKNFWNGSELNGKEQHNNNESNNNTNSSNRSSFGTDSSFSAGSTVVAADQGLHYSVTGMGTIGAGLANNSTLSSNTINGMEKPAGTNSSSNSNNTNRVQRRLSLVGGISVKLPDYQRPPISSFGCTTGGPRPRRVASTQPPDFSAATNGIFGLKSAAATSQMCLNGAGSDGKSTLSRRAQKLAQKAAHKLTIGSLSSELSSSASALYSLFTSSAENGAAPNGRSVGTAELGIYAESYLGTSQHFYHDKAPVVSAHTSRGIDFLERFGQFAKERALIEEEYAAKLKSLAKRSRGKKTEDDESKMYTTTMAFLTMLGEIESKAHLDAQGAHVKCAKADKNLHLSRIELERAKTNVNTKNAICEQSKQNYAAQLGATNQAKFDHYNVILPQLLEDMRQLDVERIEFSKKAMLDCVASETSVLNIIQRCYSDMNTAIGTINPNRDTLAVVEQTKTGFAHPLDFQFEDLGDPADILLDGTESFDGSTLRRQPGQGKGANGKGGGVATPNISSSSFCSATAVAAGSAPAPPCQQHVPYVDTGSGDFYEECDTPAAAAANGCPVPQQQSDVVLGTAIAMYAYDAAPDEVGGTTISMRDGDELLLLERDVGDGWTRVRHMQSNAEGFVPSSYLVRARSFI
uniref:SH3 domain-containing protein n=1 Tax=Globodera pallida TaxID=36090 RepID=A0A183BYV8_GLOPA